MGTMQTMRPIRGEGRRRGGMWGKSDQSTLTETERQCLSHAECHKSFFLSYVIFMTLTLLLLTDFLPCLVSPSFSLFSLLSTIPDPGTQPLQVPGSGSEIFPPCQTKTATSVSTSGQGRQPVCRSFILEAVNFLSLHSQHPPRRHSHEKHRQWDRGNNSWQHIDPPYHLPPAFASSDYFSGHYVLVIASLSKVKPNPH